MAFDVATARGYVQRDLRDESAVRWTANEIDRAVDKALDEYGLAWPIVSYLDAVKGATDTLDMTALAGWAAAVWLYALWVEYAIGNVPPTAVRFREERRGFIRIRESTQPVQGESCRVWHAKGRALADVEVQHEDIIVLGGTAFAAIAAGVGATGAVNVSGWTPRQYRDWGEARLVDFRRRLRELGDSFSSGSPAAVWSSAKL